MKPTLRAAVVVAAIAAAFHAAAEKAPATATKVGTLGWAGGSFFNSVAVNPSFVASLCAMFGAVLTAVGVTVTVIRSIRQDRRDNIRLQMQIDEHNRRKGPKNAD